MRLLRETWSYLRAAMVLVAIWAVWLLAFVGWGWSFDELRSAPDNVAAGYTAVSLMAVVAVTIGLVAAVRRPGWGGVLGGLLVTGVATIGSLDAVDQVTHWGEGGIIHIPERTAPWVPLDSLGSVPYSVLLDAGVLLLVGGIVRLRHRTPVSEPRGAWRRAGVKSLREASPSMRVVLLLVAVWALWLLAFVAWAWTVREWHQPPATDNVYFGYTVMSAVSFVIVAVGLAMARSSGWGEIAGGLVTTLLAAFWSNHALTELRHWGEIVMSVNEDRGTPWVPLDSLDLVPYWVLALAGVLLVVVGIADVLHPKHRTTPHAGGVV